MRTLASLFVATFAALALSACGDSGGDGHLTGGTGGGGGGTGTSTTSPVYSMGNGSASNFQSGMIGITDSSISAGGNTSLSISIVNQTGVLYTTSVTITINSPCVASGEASISASAGGTAVTSLTTTTGIVDAVYTAKGCSGSDVITATATVGSQSLMATGTVTVAAATVGSLQFVSASPPTIGLKGTGQATTSTLIFKVVDSTGSPVPNIPVAFVLNLTTGGITLSPQSGNTAQDGTVQTVVSAGTVATTVRVTASTTTPALSATSSVLTISTGLPVSSRFTLSVGAPSYAPSGPACWNTETYDHSQITVPFTVQLGDFNGNPVPDGTAVSLKTNGGLIVGSCVTPFPTTSLGNGICQAIWTSGNPTAPSTGALPVSDNNGRGTVWATTLGEESFTDLNGNGVWDTGEPFVQQGEPFWDANEDGVYDNSEVFLDYNNNGVWDAANTSTYVNYIGITCTGGTCAQKTLAIGTQAPIIMSTSQALVTNMVPTGGSITVTHGAPSIPLSFTITDLNGNAMPAGTTVAVGVSGSIGTVVQSPAPFTWPCDASTGLVVNGTKTPGPTLGATFVPAAAVGSGAVTITVTTPLKIVTTYGWAVTVN